MFSLWYPDTADAVHPFMVLLAALAIDALIGDPPAFYRLVPHPVAALGGLIARAEHRLNRGRARLGRGLLLVVATVTAVAVLGWAIGAGLRWFVGGWLIEAVLAAVLIAGRGLYLHARAVADGLDDGIEAGREAVAHIVGRDPASLDEAGIARAAIESVAENFSDGVVAPVLWYAALGLPGLFAYKAVNTLDSMIGHRDARYAAFGRIAARLDDIVNWIPARIAGLLITAAALGRAPEAFRIMLRDAGSHRSVNAGWQEAPMAGALGLALAGPRQYGGAMVDDAWMGDGRREATAADIRRALSVYVRASLALAAVVALGLLP